MRRLLLAAAVAAASFATPALATHECNAREVDREVRVGDAEIGVCAGTWCPDDCRVVAEVTCEGPAPIVRYCQVVTALAGG